MDVNNYKRTYTIPPQVIKFKEEYDLYSVKEILSALNSELKLKKLGENEKILALIEAWLEKIDTTKIQLTEILFKLSNYYKNLGFDKIAETITNRLKSAYSEKDDKEFKSELFSERQLEIFEKISVRESFSAGELIIKKGSVGIDMYFIVSGTATVLLAKENNETQDVDLSIGNIMGEMVHCGKARTRTADVIAKTDVEVVRFNIKELYNLEKLGLATKGDLIGIEDVISKLANKRFFENHKYVERLEDLRELLKEQRLTKREGELIRLKILELEDKILNLKK